MSDQDRQKKDHKGKDQEDEAMEEAQDWRGQYASPEKIKQANDLRDSQRKQRMANDEGIEDKGGCR